MALDAQWYELMWTGEKTHEFRRRFPTGSSEVTPSMLSGWERSRHTTSRRYRALLAGYYGQPVEELFTHQDNRAATAQDTPQLVSGPRRLRKP